ncbi:MAG: DUF819 family protein [Verrucomicrobiae bacterium]|nr:DUF819 family protein [Verrucomicrobiae bacterium]
MTSLLGPDATWPLLAAVVAGGAASIWLEQRFRWAARLGGPVLALGLAMILSNLRLLPWEAPAYGVVDDYFVPIAIPLLLLGTHLRRIWREAGSTFAAYHVAAFGSLVGAVLAAALFHAAIPRMPEVAGIMTGSYIGGGLNFMALRTTYQVEPELGNPLIVADNFIMALMFAVLVVISGARWFLRRYPHPHSGDADRVDSRELTAQHWRRKDISLLDIAQAVGFAVVVTAAGFTLSGFLKAILGSGTVVAVIANPYVLITFLTVALNGLAPAWTASIRGGEELGMFLLYLFFFVLGVRADLLEVLRNVPLLFAFCLVMALTNLVVTLVLGRCFRMNLEELLLSVNATLGGPPSAAAMAISRGWSRLVLPGLLVGIWGYVIGTPLGILVAELLRRWY